MFNAEFVIDMLKSLPEKYQFFKKIPPTIVIIYYPGTFAYFGKQYFGTV